VRVVEVNGDEVTDIQLVLPIIVGHRTDLYLMINKSYAINEKRFLTCKSKKKFMDNLCVGLCQQ